MKRMRKLVILSLMSTLTLTGCDLFKQILDLMYKDVYEFYEKEGYSTTESHDEFNALLQDKMYKWSRETITYSNSGKTNTFYYSPHGDYISMYPEYNQITLHSRYGETYIIFYGENAGNSFSYRYAENDKIVMYDGKLYYIDSDSYRQEMDEKHYKVLGVQEDDNGYGRN